MNSASDAVSISSPDEPPPPAQPPVTSVMLDLETLGTRPGSVILAIGAVKFNAGGIFASFYQRVSASSCTDLGMTIDADTVMWWLQQDNAAREELTRPGPIATITTALLNFGDWLPNFQCGMDPGKKIEMWGNGAAFDNALLAEAYAITKIPAPWDFRGDRCYRTLKNLWPHIPALERIGTRHNALDDAIHQTHHLIAILHQFHGSHPSHPSPVKEVIP